MSENNVHTATVTIATELDVGQAYKPSRWQLVLKELNTESRRQDISLHIFLKRAGEQLEVKQLQVNLERHVGSVAFYGREPGESINAVLAPARVLDALNWQVGEELEAVIVAGLGDGNTAGLRPVLGQAKLTYLAD